MNDPWSTDPDRATRHWTPSIPPPRPTSASKSNAAKHAATIQKGWPNR